MASLKAWRSARCGRPAQQRRRELGGCRLIGPGGSVADRFGKQLGPEPAQREEQGSGGGQRALNEPVEPRILDREPDVRRPEGDPQLHGRDDGHEQLPVRP